jgi:phosphoribosylaminoimidazole-succinocarboxamide synthase
MSILARADHFPIRHEGPVYNGKVRAVYWLSSEDSRALIALRGYQVPASAELGVMVITDRISAFECNWQAEDGLQGVPGKGASLNAIALHHFRAFACAGLGGHHIVDAPHPLVWIVRKARPLRFEGIARQYLTGSMWRAYERGERVFCGVSLPEGLVRHQRFDALLITPSTKGTLRGLDGVPEEEDAPVSAALIRKHASAFGLQDTDDLARANEMLTKGFALAAESYQKVGQLLVDTKFEFGFVDDDAGLSQLIYMDEVATPDSSRLWEDSAYREGRVVESCKEFFRHYLLSTLNRDILVTSSRMNERKKPSASFRVPTDVFARVGQLYQGIAESLTGQSLPVVDEPYEELMTLFSEWQLLAASDK